ncbi:MAG: hypothetical protein U0792_15005 [Gemmataceae bacterium]
MTEAEWLACDDPYRLMLYGPRRASRRQCLLAICGYARRIERYIPHRTVVLYLTECEQAADGLASIDNTNDGIHNRLQALSPSFPKESPHHRLSTSLLACLFTAAMEKPYIHPASYQSVRGAVTNLMGIDPSNDELNPRLHSESWRVAWEQEGTAQVNIIRDIFGNPFRPVAFDAEWRTSTAVALAQQMYESRDFSTMPILADALQDAGCVNEDILNHCRGDGPHVRGCWVVDMLLGKS